MMYFKVLKIQEQGKCKIRTRKEIINTKVEITKTEGKITGQRVFETKSLFFEKQSNIVKSIAKVTQKMKVPKLVKLQERKRIVCTKIQKTTGE